jgi:hypothetical protein
MERMKDSSMNATRAMLLSRKLPSIFWGESNRYYNYIRNRSPPHFSTKTRYELFFGKKPTLKKCRPFGTPVIFYNHKEKKKLDDRGREGLFLGVEEDDVRYRIYDVEKRKVVNSRDVRFHEEEEYEFEGFDFTPIDAVTQTKSTETIEEDNSTDTSSPVCTFPVAEDNSEEEDSLISTILGNAPPAQKLAVKITAAEQVPRRRSSRLNQLQEEHAKVMIGEDNSIETSSSVCPVLSSIDSILSSNDDTHSFSVNQFCSAYACAATDLEIIDNTPKTYKEALSSNLSDAWKQAIKEEQDSLERAPLYYLVLISQSFLPSWDGCTNCFPIW